MNGFTYRGKHCARFGCCHIPGAGDIGVRMESYTVDSVTVAGRAGSYWLNSRVNERTFKLDCYFEEITEATYAALLEWLRHDKAGDLIFDDRPYVAYEVRPNKEISPNLYYSKRGRSLLMSGTFSISFVANEPYGRLLIKSYDGSVDVGGALTDTGVLNGDMLPSPPSLATRQFLAYNCGTEKGQTILRIAGNIGKDGMTITNTTNGSACRIVGLAGDIPGFLEIDGQMGQVRQVVGEEKKIAFEYHDLGYVVLEPCTPIARDIMVVYEKGSRWVRGMAGCFEEEMKGQYMYQDGAWRYIGRFVNADAVELNAAMDSGGSCLTTVVTMNNILITGDGELAKLELDYVPRTR